MQCGRCHYINDFGPKMERGLCEGCKEILEFPMGYNQVSCSKCNHTTTFDLTQPRALDCAKCSTRLGYPLGATAVRCPSCDTITGIDGMELVQTTCSHCQEVLQHAVAAQSVKCSSCGGLTPIFNSYLVVQNPDNEIVYAYLSETAKGNRSIV